MPRREDDIRTSELSPADIKKLIGNLEQARQLLLDRIAHAEAEEADITDQIPIWEDLVYRSAALDVEQHRVNRM